jgi:hypothetical protein
MSQGRRKLAEIAGREGLAKIFAVVGISRSCLQSYLSGMSLPGLEAAALLEQRYKIDIRDWLEANDG